MSWSYRPSLDGLRCVAVYLVVLFHSGLSIAGGGFIGVDLFFVLSGFLITNILLSDVEETGRIRFARFYSRRVRRLLPAALLTVVVTSIVFLAVASIVERLPLVRDAQSALLYVANWHFMAQQNDYFATGVDKSPFLHFWSLAIEEQFYVVFPMLLLVLLAFARRRQRWLPVAVLGALCALSVAAQLHWGNADPSHAYYGTDTRAYQLLVGAVLACALRTWPQRPTARLLDRLAVVGLGALLLLATDWVDTSPSHRGIGAAAASALVIGAVAVREEGWVARQLSRRTPVYLGRVSYSTYLWHWPVILVARAVLPLTSFEVACLAIVVATALAALSTELLELPIRRSRTLDAIRWPVVASGVVACLVIATLIVPPVLHSDARPLVSASAAETPEVGAAGADATAKGAAQPKRSTVALHGPRQRIPKGLDWSALANDIGPARTCGPDDPRRCTVVSGGGPHVLLVGDSNARMMVPALTRLAREHGFTLSVNVMSSCPWQAGVTNLHSPPADQAACTAARGDWYRDVLPKLHPDVAILVEYARDDPIYQGTLVRDGHPGESLRDVVLKSTNETLASITRTGTRALIMKTALTSPFDPLDCLARSTYVDQCAVPVPLEWPVSDSFFETAAAASDKVAMFDINPIVCPDAPVCSPLMGRTTVWRNVNHFSTRVLVQLREKIWNAIVATGVLNGPA